MSAPQEKKRKTGDGMGEVQRKRGAEENIDVPTLGQVAEEARFAPLHELLNPVKDTPVNELGQDLRAWLKEEASKIALLPLALAFFGACDARASEAAHKRAHVASEEHSPERSYSRYSRVSAPSTYGDRAKRTGWAELQEEPDLRVMCLRPHGYERMHVAVMCPVFDLVGNLLDQGEPETRDLQLASRLCSEMGNAFETEDQRVAAVRPLLRELFGGEGVDFDVLEVAPKKGKSDGTARLDLNSMIANVEFKNEKGAGGADAYMENTSYYVHFWAARDGPAKHCCPSLLVEVVGQEIGISGAAWCAGFPCVQPLSDNVPFLLTKFDTRLMLRQARLVLALRKGVELLSEWYRERVGLEANSQAQFPHAREVTIDGQPTALTYLRFLNDGEGSDAGFAKPLLVASRGDTGEEVLVKFCAHGYGSGAHQLLAKHGLAPALYSTCQVGRFTMVVMQLVSGVQWHGPTHRDQHWEVLSGAITLLHEGGYVHGDLRPPNILVTATGPMVLDFDWAGREDAVYPFVLNHLDIEWPVGAAVRGKITKDHDQEMLARLRGD